MRTPINALAGFALACALLTCGNAAAEPAPTPPPPSGFSNGLGYTVEQSSTDGGTPDGRGTWSLIVNQISGGSPAVASAFNSAVATSAQGQLDSARQDADPELRWTFDTDPQIRFGAASISEVLSGLYVQTPSAHPSSFVSTVVIDSRTATPITLDDLFVDEQAGLDRLSEQTKILLPDVMGTGPGPMADEPGNEPLEANFANWIPTPQGLEIHFADYQFVHGSPVLTIPWTSLDDVLDPDMRALRQA
jgi:hypothetical protein